MAKATVTIRDVKNKDTGIDLAVNSYKETKAMIGSTYEYQVMVVSNMACFKTAKHKETDNVQFTVLRKFNEFEELYTKMNTKFSGTVFPPFPKKVLMMNDAVAKERRAGLDQILKYIAMTPKLCTCPVLLEFLGVSAIKAGKFRKMEVSDSVVDKQEHTEGTKEESKVEEEKSEKVATDENLFETGEDQAENEDDDADLFAVETTDSRAADDTKIFEDQDLGGGMEEGEADDLFLPDARVEKTHAVTKDKNSDEDDDLFRIEDNLEEIMQLNLKPKDPDEQADDSKAVSEQVGATKESSDPTTVEKSKDDVEPQHEEIPEEIPATVSSKPAKPAVKPKPGMKPATKPKPPISAKPGQKVTTEDTSLAETSSNSSQSDGAKQKPVTSPKPKPPLKQKPQLAAKPNVKPKPKVSSQSDSPTVDASVSQAGLPTENITEDDIMKYIQENAADAKDVDLFS